MLYRLGYASMSTPAKKRTKSPTPIERAVAALTIDDVSIIDAKSHLLEKFEPKYDSRIISIAYQIKNFVSGFEILDIGEGSETYSLLKVNIELGARIGHTEQIENEDPEILALIEATFSAYYVIKDENIIEDIEALNEFTQNNAPFNVWPYWREYLTSQLTRMNMPKITLPLMSRPTKARPKSKK